MDELQELDNDIECARCGEKFYIELTRCPHCGAHVYGEEDWEQDIPPQRNSGEPFQLQIPDSLRSMGVVALGWLVACMLGLGAYIVLRSRFLVGASGATVLALIFAPLALGAALGGYLAGLWAPGRRAMHGLAVGILSLLVTLPLSAHEFGNALAVYLSLPGLVGLGAVLLAGYGGASLAARLALQEQMQNLFRPLKRNQGKLYQELLTRTRHDQELAERLIDYEWRRNPDAGRAALIENAIARWERDNR